MPSPPSTIKGEVIVTTKATCQVNRKQIKHEKISPNAASTPIERLSVVSPFNALMSSVITLVNTPGDLALLSYQPILLCMSALNSFTRKV